MEFDIHGLVCVRLETRDRRKIDQVMHQIREFESSNADARTPDLIVEDYASAPRTDQTVVIDNHYFFDGDGLDIPSYKLRFELASDPIRIWCDRLWLPLNLLVHLVLLRKGGSLLHSAAFELEGRSFVFPAFGGIGKTTLVAAAMSENGRLYGDDLNIAIADRLLGYPVDFSIYPYHMRILGLSDKGIARAFARTAVLDRLTAPLEESSGKLARALRVVLNSFKVPCVSVPPRRIFGDGFRADAAPLSGVFYLWRCARGRGGISVKRCDPEVLAAQSADILFHEWHESLRFLVLYSALANFSWVKCYEATREAIATLFRAHSCHAVEIPVSMDQETYRREIMELLRRHTSGAEIA